MLYYRSIVEFDLNALKGVSKILSIGFVVFVSASVDVDICVIRAGVGVEVDMCINFVLRV